MQPTLLRKEVLERHALVLSFWLGFGLVGLALIKLGFSLGDPASILFGFALLIVGFVAHILINRIYSTNFTQNEIALGLFLYCLSLLVFVFSSIVYTGLDRSRFIAGTAGFLLIFVSVVFFMVTRFGLRKAFKFFDIIRKF
jgi:hypothetical protein